MGGAVLCWGHAGGLLEYFIKVLDIPVADFISDFVDLGGRINQKFLGALNPQRHQVVAVGLSALLLKEAAEVGGVHGKLPGGVFQRKIGHKILLCKLAHHFYHISVTRRGGV